jgi:hypothetical protein
MARVATAVALTLAACTPAAPAPTPTTLPTTTTSTTTTTTTAPTTTTTTHRARAARVRVAPNPAQTPTEGMPGQEATLAAIARCESGGRYDAENPTSTASGRYQVLDSTWDGYGGYERAVDAPPEVQEAWAREAYARAGTAPWRASRGCWRGAA